MWSCKGVGMTKKRYPEGDLYGDGIILYFDSSGGYMYLSIHVIEWYKTIYTLYKCHGFAIIL